jgi:hypothetical protein
MRVDMVLRSALAVLALYGAMSDAWAGEVIQSVSNLCVPATALSLTLVTAVIRSQK